MPDKNLRNRSAAIGVRAAFEAATVRMTLVKFEEDNA